MKILLDTHALLWWLDDDPRLGRRARGVIADGTNDILVSMASLWEVAIKHRIGKLRANVKDIAARLPIDDFVLLPIKYDHLQIVESYRDAVHNDPFDHLILAQAAFEGARLMTNDALMQHYGVATLQT